MSKVQDIEISRYQPKITDDLRQLVEKYREIMAWDVPENDPVEADRLIFQAINTALEAIVKTNKQV